MSALAFTIRCPICDHYITEYVWESEYPSGYSSVGVSGLPVARCHLGHEFLVRRYVRRVTGDMVELGEQRVGSPGSLV